MSDNVSYSFDDGISTIRLERPEKLNAMRLDMWDAVTEGVKQADADGARAIVLTGEGEHFCAGDDIQALADIEDERDVRELADTLLDCWNGIERSPVPVIGRANGSAHGGGFELLLAADLTVVPADATFQLSEARIGAFPPYASKRLAQLVGRQRAMDLALLSREITGEQAVEWGLFARAVPEDRVDEEVEAIVDALHQASPASVETAKAWLNASLQFPGEDEGMRNGLGYLFSGPDAHEGARAFLEGREPDFVQ